MEKNQRFNSLLYGDSRFKEEDEEYDLSIYLHPRCKRRPAVRPVKPVLNATLTSSTTDM